MVNKWSRKKLIFDNLCVIVCMEPSPNWDVVFYISESGKSPVTSWLEALQEKDRAKIARTIGLLRTYGTQLLMPHARKLRGKLFELRVASGVRDYRVLYFAVIGRRFILLHGFAKKTQKTPTGALELAERRMKEWEIRNAKNKPK